MAISFVNGWSSSSNAASSLTINTSGGTQAQVGDVYVLCISYYSGVTITAPSGWSNPVPEIINTQWNAALIVYVKAVASGDIGASYTINWSGAAFCSGGILCFRGVNTTTPVDAAGTGDTGDNTLSITASSITPASSGDVLIWTANAFPEDLSNGSAITPPSGFVANVWDVGFINNNHDGNVASYQLGISSGATGAKTGTPSVNEAYAAVLLALQPTLDQAVIRPLPAPLLGNQPWWAAPQRLKQQNVVFRAANLPDPYRHSMAPIPTWQSGMTAWWAPITQVRSSVAPFRAANLADPYRHSMGPIPAWQAGMQGWWAPAVSLRTKMGVLPTIVAVSTAPSVLPLQAIQQAWWIPVAALHPTAGDYRAAALQDQQQLYQLPLQAIGQPWWAPVSALHPTAGDYRGATENDARPSQLPIQAIQGPWWAPVPSLHSTAGDYRGATENDARPARLPFQAIQQGWWAPVSALHPTTGDYRGATELDWRPTGFPFQAVQGSWWAPIGLARTTVGQIVVVVVPVTPTSFPFAAIQQNPSPSSALAGISGFLSSAGPPPPVGDPIVVWRHRAGMQ
jgi:hypothetical protein